MAHFAELDENNIVLRVIVVANDKCLDQNDVENESIGALFCHNLLDGRWVQTSYNGNIRGKYAGIGDTYDANADVFISPQPYPSWSLDENYDWQPPTPMPQDGINYVWDEVNLVWQAPPVEEIEI
jgi:hypothetical protein